MKFQLLRGSHAEGSAKEGTRKVYQPGDIIESKVNLLKFNPKSRQLQPKFAKVDESMVATAARQGFENGNTALLPEQQDNLEAMTVEQLRSFAAEEGIDVSKARTKEQLVSTIERARGA